ncbi:MAG: guanylate kinase [Lachnospiraceae bacterium]|nr:guanylate kinase [Candidatus Merdinaster equi]
MEKRGSLTVISGFAGVGKGTLVKKLLQDYDCYALSISATTRAPRPGEEHGREYFFVTKEEFEDKIKGEGFIEYAQYVGNYYGTPREYVEQQLSCGKDVILEIEIQGALQIKKKFPDSVLVYILPPSAKELEARLRGRGTETEEKIVARLSRAAKESEGLEEYDYIIVNDDIEAAKTRLHGVIQASHNAPVRNKEFIAKIREEVSGFAKGE